MRNIRKHISSGLLALSLAVGCLFAFSGNAEAKTPTYTRSGVYVLTNNKNDQYVEDGIGANEDNFGSGGFEEMKITSSNSKVLQITKVKDQEYKYNWKKAGKVTVTYNYYYGDTKQPDEVIKVNYTVVASPIKSLKVGKKEYAKKLKHTKKNMYDSGTYVYNTNSVTVNGTAGKISLKLNKGWKVSKAVLTANGKSKTVNVKKLSVSKKSKLRLTLKKGKTTAYVTYVVK